MKYLEENQLNFLRDITSLLPGALEFVEYKERHFTNMGNINGAVFEAFGDEWNFYMFPGDFKARLECVNHNPDELNMEGSITSGVIDPTLDAAIQVITDYYFNPRKS